MRAVPAAQVTVRENGRSLRNEPVIFPYKKAVFFRHKEVDVLGDEFPNGG